MWDKPKAPKKPKTESHHSRKEGRSSTGWFVFADLSPEQAEEVRRLYSEGASKNELMKQFHYSRDRLDRCLADIARPFLRTFTDIEIEEIRELYSQGNSIKALERKFHTNYGKIRKALEGLLTPPAPPPISEDQKEEIRQAHAEGQSIRSLALRFEVDRRTIYRVLGIGVATDCPYVITVEGFTYHCHLKTHDKGTHRTTWRDGEDTQFRVEWR